METSYCRACRKTNKPLKSLYTHKYGEMHLNVLFFLTTGVPARQNESFSCEICTTCERRMIGAFEFRQRVQLADRHIRLEAISPKETLPASSSQSSESPKRKRYFYQFWCNECGRTTSGKIAMLRHLVRFHFPQLKQYLCPICACQYAIKREMEMHLLERHGVGQPPERTFNCDLCDRQFLTGGKLKSHLVSHHTDGPRTFECPRPDCSKAFQKASQLKRHTQIVHETDEQICPKCTKVFRTKEHLRLHVRNTHNPNLGYKCHICSAAFRVAYTLKNHLTTHTQETYKCSGCLKGFRFKHGLRKHFIRKHPVPATD